MAPGALTVGVLGPLEVAVDGRPLTLTAGRLRALLAVLAMSAGRAVSVDRIAAALWDDDLPEVARRSVQTYVTRLRAALGGVTISSGQAGYVLHADPERVDALRFGRLLDTANRCGDPPAERALVEEALALWRGTPFDGVPSQWLSRFDAPRLLERWLAAIERRADMLLAADAAGGLADLVGELRGLTADHPLREPLWLRLLVALQRSGRSAEALQAYEQIRSRLADELGTDPSPELRRLHLDLLAGTTAPAEAEPEVVPQQLPADIVASPAGRKRWPCWTLSSTTRSSRPRERW